MESNTIKRLQSECEKKHLALKKYASIIHLQRRIIHELKSLINKDDFYKIKEQFELASDYKLSDSPKKRKQ